MRYHYSPHEIKAIRIHLRKLLPNEAFARAPLLVVPMLVHVLVLFATIVTVGRTDAWWQWALCALVGGHSMAVSTFYAHHLSHGHLLARGPLRSALEYLIWTVTLQPTTVWRETHNHVHHQNTNAMRDAFRYYSDRERTSAHGLYTWLMIPHRDNWWNPLVFVAPTFLHLVHALAALFAPRAKIRVIVTHLGDYDTRDRIHIALELTLIAAFQVVVFHVCGGSWERYAWAGLATMSVASLIAGAYTYSQHSKHDLCEHDNPFATTTLKMSRVLDTLHCHIAHHTAHHVFYGLNPNYLPYVTELLRQHYPETLDEVTLLECWRAIYRNPAYKVDPARNPATPRGARA